MVGATTAQEALQQAGAHHAARPIALVKVDTEGAEVVVVRSLRGAGLLSRVANLVVELTPQWWRPRHNVSLEEGVALFASLFTAHGFQLALRG